MKLYLTCLLITIFQINISIAQVQSSCVPSTTLLVNYDHEIKDLAVRRIFQVLSPDTAKITVSQHWQDTIQESLAAVYNSNIPQADSFFFKYCVREWRSSYAWNQFFIYIDTSVAWTHAWMNYSPLTGNTSIDSLVLLYGITVLRYINLTGLQLHMVVLKTNNYVNSQAFVESLRPYSGIKNIYVNGILASTYGGKIDYTKVGSDRFLDLWFQWRLCNYDCMYARKWKFKIDQDCKVEYLGFDNCLFRQPISNVIYTLPRVISNCYYNDNDGGAIWLPVLSVNDKHLVYPNPAITTLNFKLTNNDYYEATIKICDVLGRTVMERVVNNQKFSIDVRSLQTGMYFYQITYNNKTLSGKVLIGR